MSSAKNVIITGAGGHLGRAFTSVFGRAGYSITGLDIDEKALVSFAAAAEAVGAEHLALNCDIRNWGDIAQAVTVSANRFGRIDVVINNATARTSPTMKPLEECTEEEFDAVIAVGPRAALGLMRAALPYLKESRGKVISIGSGAGLNGANGLGPYGICKAALHALTHSAALEWGEHGITANGILPLAMTDHFAGLLAKGDKIKHLMPPIGRMGEAERDIGALALFLASPEADYISGQNISADGGMTRR